MAPAAPSVVALRCCQLQNQTMLSLACFVAIGAVMGFLLPLPAFAIFSLVTLVAYAAFANDFSGMGRAYNVIFAAVALQLGYFLSVLMHWVLARYLKPAGTGTPETKNEVRKRRRHR
jgi:hypothetical protein